MTETAEILQEILNHKREEVEQQRQKRGVQELKGWIEEQESVRGFALALESHRAQQKMAVIAEIKRASPSRGVLCDTFDPLSIARSYMMSGAACLSILTDHRFFMGSGAILDLVRRHCPLPALRKDFIIDEYQIYESRAYGADCILLIVAALWGQQLQDLSALARAQGMDVLVEVHDEKEMEEALELGDDLRLIGINNRKLHTFEVDLNTTFNLAKQVPEDKLIISESGISKRQDIEHLISEGIYACLVGEALMISNDPGKALKQLIGCAS